MNKVQLVNIVKLYIILFYFSVGLTFCKIEFQGKRALILWKHILIDILMNEIIGCVEFTLKFSL